MAVTRRGQASMELAAAIIGALVLLVGAVKLVAWAAERSFTRVRNYDQGRRAAASTFMPNPNQPPDTSYEPATKLDLFN